MRVELVERGRPLLESSLLAVTGRRVASLHTDISTVTGERVFVFILESFPEFSPQGGRAG